MFVIVNTTIYKLNVWIFRNIYRPTLLWKLTSVQVIPFQWTKKNLLNLTWCLFLRCINRCPISGFRFHWELTTLMFPPQGICRDCGVNWLHRKWPTIVENYHYARINFISLFLPLFFFTHLFVYHGFCLTSPYSSEGYAFLFLAT